MRKHKDRKQMELIEIDRGIRDFYTGVINANAFVDYYWQDTWESLISYVQTSGFNIRDEKVPQALLDKKAEFKAALEKYKKTKKVSRTKEKWCANI